VNYFDNPNYAVIVVGAGRGIGRAAALELAAQGTAVACFDSDPETAQKVAGEIKAGGGKAIGAHLDVTQPGSMRPAVEKAAAEFRRIDALVNCAGITGRTNIPAHEVDPEDFDLVYRVNLRGALLLSQVVLPHMLTQRYGRILHVASIAGKEGNAGMTAYSATKAGLIGMVKSMAKDYVEQGITINALAPAVIRTPMVDALPQATVDYMTAKIPMRRCGELEEAAQMIAWIVSPACSFTTGFTFDLTGGRATYLRIGGRFEQDRCHRSHPDHRPDAGRR
jgi:NAD(P)-dependent dehydrogenase (short-subunit alcohol dehydrogenase family)